MDLVPCQGKFIMKKNEASTGGFGAYLVLR